MEKKTWQTKVESLNEQEREKFKKETFPFPRKKIRSVFSSHYEYNSVSPSAGVWMWFLPSTNQEEVWIPMAQCWKAGLLRGD